MRRLWLVLLCGALLPVSPAQSARAARDSGILVRLQPPRFAVRELDGSRVTFRVNRATVVTLNGRRVRLRRLQLGDVVVVAHAGKLATTVRAVRP